jgi:hypothetical protein
MQRGSRIKVFDQEHGEHADQIGSPVESLANPFHLPDHVHRQIGMGVVVRIASLEYRMQQVLFGLEMMQQSGGGDPGLMGDLTESRAAPAIPGEQSLGDSKNPLTAILSPGQKSGIRPRIRHWSPFTNLLNTH